MFVSNKLVFIELNKTASTHITKLLIDIIGGQQIGKHNAATQKEFSLNVPFIESIHNPWDWYVSLWAFGCDGKGGMSGFLNRPKFSFTGLGWKNHPIRASRNFCTFIVV